MEISTLTIQGLRCFESIAFEPSTGLNFFYGGNGSGKSTLLEALVLLSTGSSFRTNKIQSLQRDKETPVILRAEAQDELSIRHAIAIQRAADQNTVVRVDGESLPGIAALSSLLPTQVIFPEKINLVTGGPKDRRRFFDWGVFHSEESFYGIWKHYNVALKQRNTLLRKQASVALINPWSIELAKYAMQLHELRERYFQQFVDELSLLSADFLGDDITLSLTPGWSKNESIEAALAARLPLDQQRGFTSVGAHRMDLKVLINGKDPEQYYSAGYIKKVIYLFKLVQASLLSKGKRKRPIILCDDLFSELDQEASTTVIELLQRMEAQTFITTCDERDLHSLGQDVTAFHVKHSCVERM